MSHDLPTIPELSTVRVDRRCPKCRSITVCEPSEQAPGWVLGQCPTCGAKFGSPVMPESGVTVTLKDESDGDFKEMKRAAKRGKRKSYSPKHGA